MPAGGTASEQDTVDSRPGWPAWASGPLFMPPVLEAHGWQCRSKTLSACRHAPYPVRLPVFPWAKQNGPSQWLWACGQRAALSKGCGQGGQRTALSPLPMARHVHSLPGPRGGDSRGDARIRLPCGRIKVMPSRRKWFKRAYVGRDTPRAPGCSGADHGPRCARPPTGLRTLERGWRS